MSNSESTDRLLKSASDKIVDRQGVCEDNDISWKHFFYKIWYNFCELFRNPYKKPQKDLNLLEQVEILLASEGTIDENLLQRCEHLIKLHRITENTNARKRLEKWTKSVIVSYLVIVGLVVALCTTKLDFCVFGCHFYFVLSDTVLVTILSTTTVNIIALALILMKGHFPHKEDGKQAEKAISQEI